MNVAEITEQLYLIGGALLAKTGEKPWVAPKLEIVDGACSIDLMREYKLEGPNNYRIGAAKGETPDAAIAEAFKMIAALPSEADAKIRKHMARVADCIDRGREDGIDNAYIEPLVVVKAAMTGNLLTKQVAQ